MTRLFSFIQAGFECRRFSCYVGCDFFSNIHYFIITLKHIKTFIHKKRAIKTTHILFLQNKPYMHICIIYIVDVVHSMLALQQTFIIISGTDVMYTNIELASIFILTIRTVQAQSRKLCRERGGGTCKI